MGAWSASVFGNDTSCEVKEFFNVQYNSGLATDEIIKLVNEQYDFELNSEEERGNVLLALAYCLWGIKALDNELFAEVKALIKNGTDLRICKELGADKKFLNSREKYLQKYLEKISIPKEVAKKRVKPPTEIDSIYRDGACMAFQYDNGIWGVIISVSSAFYRRKAELFYALTDIESKELPTMQAVLSAYLMDKSYHTTPDDFLAGKLHLYGYMIDSKGIKNFYEYNDKFFKVIGYLPEWDYASGALTFGCGYREESYEEFSYEKRQHLLEILKDERCTVETIKEISERFTNKDIAKQA